MEDQDILLGFGGHQGVSHKRKASDEDDSVSPPSEPDASADLGQQQQQPKPVKRHQIKFKRGSRACLACRKIKSKCRGSDNPPCERCTIASLDCVFEESRRSGNRKNRDPDGKRKEPTKKAPAKSTASPPKKHDALPTDIAVFPSSGARLPTLSATVPPAQTFNLSIDPPPLDFGAAFSSGSSGLDPTALVQLHNSVAPTMLGHQSSLADNPPFNLPPSPFTTSEERLADASFRTFLSPNGQTIGSGTATLHPSPFGPPSRPLPPAAAHALESDGMSLAEQMGEHSWNGPTRPNDADELAPQKIFEEESLRSRRTDYLDNRSQPSTPPTADDASAVQGGIGDDHYFTAPKNPSSAKPSLPKILEFISMEDLEELFRFYFENINGLFAVLSAEHHTATRVANTSPMLLTVICGISAHFHPKYQEVSPRINRIARRLCFEVPSRGFKTVEIVQALLLSTCWTTTPPQRHKEDNTWSIFALCKSTLQDIGLDRLAFANLPNPENMTWQQANQVRTWIYCWIRDQRLSQQLGKPSSLREDKIIAAAELYLPLGQIHSDRAAVYICELELIVTRTVAILQRDKDNYELTGVGIDLMLITRQFEDALVFWKERCVRLNAQRAKEAVTANQKQIFTFQKASQNFRYHYSLLIVCSFGLHAALQREPLDVGYYFNRCYTAAAACIRIAKQDYAGSGQLRFAPDSTFVCISYAAVSLLRFCRPKLARYHSYQTTILELLNSIADTLESVSVTPRHVSTQYSQFLRALIHAQQDGVTTRISSRQRSPELTTTEYHDLGLPHQGENSSGPSEPSPMTMNGDFGQTLPSQWWGIDSGFSNVDDLGLSTFWDSLLLPGMGGLGDLNTTEGQLA